MQCLRGGDIEIETKVESNNKVVVAISDNGEGINKECLSHIFEPFYTTRGEEGGQGLGLALCQSIIDEHGGTIGVTSQEGQGSRFMVTFEQAGATA